MSRAAVLRAVGSDEPGIVPERPDREVYAPTQSNLAWVFGVNVSLIRTYLADGAPQKVEQGYNLRDWLVWWLHRQAENQPEHPDATRRYREARAGCEEEKLKRLRGEVIPRVEAAAERLKIVRWLSDFLDRLPAEAAQSLPPPRAKAKKILEGYVAKLRSRLVTDGDDES